MSVVEGLAGHRVVRPDGVRGRPQLGGLVRQAGSVQLQRRPLERQDRVVHASLVGEADRLVARAGRMQHEHLLTHLGVRRDARRFVGRDCVRDDRDRRRSLLDRLTDRRVTEDELRDHARTESGQVRNPQLQDDASPLAGVRVAELDLRSPLDRDRGIVVEDTGQLDDAARPDLQRHVCARRRG